MAGWWLGRLTVPVPSLMLFGVVQHPGDEDQRRGDGLGGIGDVLAEIALGEAQPVGDQRQLAVLPKHLGELAAERVDRHGEKTEFHRPSQSCDQLALSFAPGASIAEGRQKRPALKIKGSPSR